MERVFLPDFHQIPLTVSLNIDALKDAWKANLGVDSLKKLPNWTMKDSVLESQPCLFLDTFFSTHAIFPLYAQIR